MIRTSSGEVTAGLLASATSGSPLARSRPGSPTVATRAAMGRYGPRQRAGVTATSVLLMLGLLGLWMPFSRDLLSSRVVLLPLDTPDGAKFERTPAINSLQLLDGEHGGRTNQQAVQGPSHHSVFHQDDNALDAICKDHWARGIQTHASAALVTDSTVFIALNLHNNAQVLPHLIKQLLRLIGWLKDKSGAFVSVYESGSSDATPALLKGLHRELDLLRVSHQILCNTTDIRGRGLRIEHLASIRNRAIQPLLESPRRFSRLLFLNDVYFCAEEALFLMMHKAHVASGLDVIALRPKQWQMNLYDTWVVRAIDGKPLSPAPPHIHEPIGASRMAQGLPAYVQCTWNGMVSIDPAVFVDANITFRTRLWRGDCSASEMNHFCRDIWRAYGEATRIILNPNVVVAYEQNQFEYVDMARHGVRPESGDGAGHNYADGVFPRTENGTDQFAAGLIDQLIEEASKLASQPPPLSDSDAATGRSSACCPLQDSSAVANFYWYGRDHCYPEAHSIPPHRPSSQVDAAGHLQPAATSPAVASAAGATSAGTGQDEPLTAATVASTTATDGDTATAAVLASGRAGTEGMSTPLASQAGADGTASAPTSGASEAPTQQSDGDAKDLDINVPGFTLVFDVGHGDDEVLSSLNWTRIEREMEQIRRPPESGVQVKVIILWSTLGAQGSGSDGVTPLPPAAAVYLASIAWSLSMHASMMRVDVPWVGMASGGRVSNGTAEAAAAAVRSVMTDDPCNGNTFFNVPHSLLFLDIWSFGIKAVAEALRRWLPRCDQETYSSLWPASWPPLMRSQEDTVAPAPDQSSTSPSAIASDQGTQPAVPSVIDKAAASGTGLDTGGAETTAPEAGKVEDASAGDDFLPPVVELDGYGNPIERNVESILKELADEGIEADIPSGPLPAGILGWCRIRGLLCPGGTIRHYMQQ